MPEIRILTAADVRLALPMGEAIAGMREAFSQLSAGKAVLPLRSRIEVTRHQGTSLFMPAYLAGTDQMAIKIASVFPNNAQRGEPTIYAAVLLLDPATGRLLALMEGSSLTAIRTGAASGAATDLLALPGASTAAIIGSGVQARTQLEAVCTVRPITKVRIYSRNADHAHQFARDSAGTGPIPRDIEVCSGARAAVRGADIICTATTSPSPVFSAADLKPGVHISAVGSFTPGMQEVDSETVRRAYVVVDQKAAALSEAGDLIIPLNRGIVDETHVSTELGDIFNGIRPGRASEQQITLFKSVGLAVQDVVAGQIAYERAEAQNLGTTLSL